MTTTLLATPDPVPYCSCGHAQQIHGGAGRYLEHDGPRGAGHCTATRCPCERFSPRKDRPT